LKDKPLVNLGVFVSSWQFLFWIYRSGLNIRRYISGIW